LREIKQRAGKVATKDQLVTIITEAMANEYWQLAVYCAAVAAGTQTAFHRRNQHYTLNRIAHNCV